MEKIKFRGQTRRKGEYLVNMAGDKCASNWVYGGIFPQNNGGDFAVIYQQEPEIKKYSVYADTVGQYKGFNDRNGTEVYDGDICYFYTPDDKDGIAIIKEDYVEWISGTIFPTRITPLYYLKCKILCTVIGNIYDNPELLNNDLLYDMKDKLPKQTNADWIRGLNNTELEDLIKKILSCGALISREASSMECHGCTDGFCCNIQGWLAFEHKERDLT